MFKPTLAVNADLTKLVYPVYASPKLDGIRASVVNNKALTRALKSIPNLYISDALSRPEFNGFDGELIIGKPTNKTVYTETVSGVMRVSGQPTFTYYVFDLHDMDAATYDRRLEELKHLNFPSNFTLLRQELVHDEAELLAYEQEKVEEGYEGVILRSPTSPYKFGRSTVNEGYMLKVKRFVDSEAEVIEVIEEQFNGNEAQTNELGRTKRSSHQAGKVGKDRMGALLVRDMITGVEFQVGTGFNDADRAKWWECKNDKRFPVIKYKFFPVGVVDKPRHPVFLGIRSYLDL